MEEGIDHHLGETGLKRHRVHNSHECSRERRNAMGSVVGCVSTKASIGTGRSKVQIKGEV